MSVSASTPTGARPAPTTGRWGGVRAALAASAAATLEAVLALVDGGERARTQARLEHVRRVRDAYEDVVAESRAELGLRLTEIGLAHPDSRDDAERAELEAVTASLQGLVRASRAAREHLGI